MQQHDDNDEPLLRIKLQAPRRNREQGRRPLRAATRAATAAMGTRRTSRRKPTYRLTGTKRLVDAPSLRSQQVVVQAHIWYNRSLDSGQHSAARANLATHLAYISRDGAGARGERARLFGSREINERTIGEFARDLSRQPHMFRFIVSPQRGGALNLEAFTRDLMDQLGADLRVAPDWLAAVHTDTDQPHVHIELAGTERAGNVLKIHEDYLFRGLRYRAQELATIALGSRREVDVEHSLTRAVEARRLTRLDRALIDVARASQENAVTLESVRSHAHGQRAVAAAKMDRILRHRLAHLVELGLARKVRGGRWELDPDLARRLAEMGRQGDIVKALQRSRGGQYRSRGQIRAWDGATMAGRWIEGRVVARHIVDELTDREVLVIEATDGATYSVPLNRTAEQLGACKAHDLVRVSGGRSGYPNVYLQSRVTLEEQVESPGRTWLDGKLLQQMRDGTLPGAELRAGFGAEVATHLVARKAVLRQRGLIAPDEIGEGFVARAMATLYVAELDVFHRKTGHAYGTQRAFTPDVETTGRLEVVQLASGPHALLVERGAYRLTPLRPSMVKHVGREVGITLSRAALERPLDRTAEVRVRGLDLVRERGGGRQR